MTGKDKKMNYPILKHIRITENQEKNWNPKHIRDFLENKVVSNQNERFLFLKSLFEKGVVKVYKDKLTPEEIKKLEEM